MFDALTAFVASPSVGLLVLFVLIIEGLVLIGLRITSGRGLTIPNIISFLGAGAAFAVCLYGALSGFGAIWIGLSLMAAFAFHIWDLKQRWNG
ncbi:MAG: hypothetical protein AAGF28_04190 [Pseudomonadota bacterium]